MRRGAKRQRGKRQEYTPKTMRRVEPHTEQPFCKMDIIERTCTASSPAMCYVVLRVGVYEISAEIPPFCILYVVVCCLPIYLYVVIPPLSLKYDVTDPYSAGFTSRVQCPVE